MDKICTWDVVGWQEFQLSLPDPYRKPEVIDQLKFWYHREIEQLISYVIRLKEADKPYYAYLGRIEVNAGGSQMVANFSVKDLTKEDDPNKVNWHLQNMSQWVYAGAIVVDKHAIARGDERVVSTHH
jgi:hypothetical protein